MSFLTRFLFRTPPEDEKKSRDIQSEPPPRPMAFPSKPLRLSSHRWRSLSQVFTTVPTNLPSQLDIKVDCLEWMCHICLLQTDAALVREWKSRIEHSLEETDAANTNVFRCGRIFGRLQLTAFYCDIAGRSIGTADEELDDNSQHPTVPTLSQVPSETWQDFIDKLSVLRALFLRKDINTKPSAGFVEDPTPDAELAVHDMMTDEYEAVVLALNVQLHLAALKEQLWKIEHDRPRLINADVRAAVKECQAAFQEMKVPIAISLHSDSPKSRLVDRVIQQICDVCFKDDHPQSYAALQTRTRGLLIKWSERLLDAPVLFQLGYGGVQALLNNNDDDISSFGDENNEPLDELNEVPVAAAAAAAAAIGMEPISLPPLSPTMRSASKVAFSEQPQYISRADSIEVPEETWGLATQPSLPLETPPSPPLETPPSPSRPLPASKRPRSEDDDWVPPAESREDENGEISGPETQDPDEENHNKRRRVNAVNSMVTAAKSPPGRVQWSGSSSEDEGKEVPALSSPKGTARSLPKRLVWSSEDEVDGEPRSRSVPGAAGRTRVFFTDDEVNAIREGIDLFGVGKWTQIKKHFKTRLAARDPVQIKDKFRNMQRTNQI